MSQQRRASFVYLPKELHLEIFRCLKDTPKSPKAYCKILRLIHPCVAQLEDIKIFLFESILIRPTNERLNDVSGLCTIIPYIRHLDFEPVRMGARGTMTQLISFLNLLPTARHVTLRGCPQPMPTTDKAQRRVVPEAVLLADFAAQCFNKAQDPVVKLELRYFDFCFAEMMELESWRNLDLSALRDLHLHSDRHSLCNVYSIDSHPLRFGSGGGVADAITNFLSRCAERLERLVLCDARGFHFFRSSVPMPAMPYLRELTLRGMRMEQPMFLFWLDKCTALESICLGELRLNGNSRGLTYWRPLFSALAHHPNKLDVTIRKIALWTSCAGTLSLRHHTSRPAEDTSHLHRRKRCRVRVRLCMMIKNYMSNLGDWDLKSEGRLGFAPRVPISDMPNTCCEQDETYIDPFR